MIFVLAFRAEKLHLKLNYTPSGEADPLLAGEQTYKKFEEELEINDFPQQARWKVNHFPLGAMNLLQR